jgi:hypothetical protein
VKRAGLLVLLLLAVAMLLGWLERTPHAVVTTAPALQLPGRSGAAGHGGIAEVRIVFGDGYKQIVSGEVDTATAVPTASNTPRPTATPALTPTATPAITPEATELSPVTATVVPPDTSCYAGVISASGLNVRADHVITAARLGTLAQAARVPVTQIHIVKAEGDPKREEWGQITYNGATAWIALWYNGEELARLDDNAFCWSVPLEYEEQLLPSTPVVRAGPHILMGEGGSAVLPYAAHISAAKCLPGAYQICLTLKSANPDIVIIARPLTDDIALNYHYDPLLAWDAVKGTVPAGFDALELENEYTPPDTEWPQWVQFSIGLAHLVQRDTGMQYLAFSFRPGAPAYEKYPLLLPYLNWVATHRLPDGRYHGIAIHAAPYATFNRPDMPWVNSLHVASRIYLARGVLLANTGFDLATWPGLIAVTEVGLSNGYSGNWDAPYTCQEAADAFRTTQATYQAHGYPQIEIWWNFGQLGWHSDDACAGAMFGSLSQPISRPSRFLLRPPPPSPPGSEYNIVANPAVRSEAARLPSRQARPAPPTPLPHASAVLTLPARR